MQADQGLRVFEASAFPINPLTAPDESNSGDTMHKNTIVLGLVFRFLFNPSASSANSEADVIQQYGKPILALLSEHRAYAGVTQDWINGRVFEEANSVCRKAGWDHALRWKLADSASTEVWSVDWNNHLYSEVKKFYKKGYNRFQLAWHQANHDATFNGNPNNPVGLAMLPVKGAALAGYWSYLKAGELVHENPVGTAILAVPTVAVGAVAGYVAGTGYLLGEAAVLASNGVRQLFTQATRHRLPHLVFEALVCE